MRNHRDQSIYRTFEDFEREEMRRADVVSGAVDHLFDDMFADEVDLDAGRNASADYGDDEE